MQNSIFNILGPVMIGPSSSHTAGAQRLGLSAFMLADGNISKVIFYLHGSFAKTYKGHGTDKALVGGVLGMSSYDKNIRYSLEIATKKGLDFSFIEKDLGDVHPNTVMLEIFKCNGDKIELIGSSIGGGSIEITSINGLSCSITGNFPTIVISHRDKVGMINNITELLSKKGINIVSIKNSRNSRGEDAFTVIETDEPISDIKADILQIPDTFSAEVINKF